MQSTVTGTGNVEAGSDVNVNFNTSGTLQNVYVSVGPEGQPRSAAGDARPDVCAAGPGPGQREPDRRAGPADCDRERDRDVIVARLRVRSSGAGSSSRGHERQPDRGLGHNRVRLGHARVARLRGPGRPRRREHDDHGRRSPPPATTHRRRRPTSTHAAKTSTPSDEPSGEHTARVEPTAIEARRLRVGLELEPGIGRLERLRSGSRRLRLGTAGGSELGLGRTARGARETTTTTTTSTTPSPASIASAQASVYSAEASVHNAQIALANTKLYAPDERHDRVAVERLARRHRVGRLDVERLEQLLLVGLLLERRLRGRRRERDRGQPRRLGLILVVRLELGVCRDRQHRAR